MRASYVTASVTICTFVHSCIMQVRFHTKSVPALSSNEFPMGKQNNGNWNTQTRQHCFSTIIAYLGFFFCTSYRSTFVLFFKISPVLSDSKGMSNCLVHSPHYVVSLLPLHSFIASPNPRKSCFTC